MLTEKFVKWEPDWTPEERARIDQTKAQMRQQIAVLRELRLKLGMTQKEMSALLETTQSNVSKMEQKSDPTLSVLRRIVEAKGGRLHVTAEVDGRSIELSV
ncbi:MAG TPA: helix-turn-helix transcriptional regulator [Caulobacteraceae bacterium]